MSSQLASQSQDRQRVRRACELCRKKKIKCNGEDPCYRCASCGTFCEYLGYSDHVKIAEQDNVSKLESRVAAMGQEFESRVASMEGLLQQLLERLKNNEGVVENAVRRGPASGSHETNERGHGGGALTPLAPTQPSAALLLSPLQQENVDIEVSQDLRLAAVSQRNIGNLLEKESGPRAQDHALVPYHQCYSDGFGELVKDLNGLSRYVGLGSTGYIVDRCAGLRRYIDAGLKRKGYETGESFLTSQLTPEHDETTALLMRVMPQFPLPPRKLVKVLFEAYREELYPIFPIISESALWELYDRFVDNEKVDFGYAAVFFSALAAASPLIQEGSATFDDIDEKYSEETLGRLFYSLANFYSNFPSNTRKNNASQPKDNIIAFGLLSMYLAETGSQGEAWVMNGRAIRLGQDIGLHRSPVQLGLPVDEQDERRYIWWCLFVMERQLCTALGRPLSIDNTDCDVEFPSQVSSFVTLIHLYKILGFILKTVNSVKNASAWRQAAKHEELRAKVRDLNSSLQTWAKEQVPQVVKKATPGKLLTQKHIFLSSYYSAVMALYRVFMPHPHRQSPLENSQAQRRCAKVATDCIRGSSDFLNNVNKGHYRVLHGQNIFVCAIVLLQCIRNSDDQAYISDTVLDVHLALQTLAALDGSWKGARKCRGVVEEYLELTVLVQRGYYERSFCNFGLPVESDSTLKATNSKKRVERPQTVRPLPQGTQREAKRPKQTQFEPSNHAYKSHSLNRVDLNFEARNSGTGRPMALEETDLISQYDPRWPSQTMRERSEIAISPLGGQNEVLLDDFFGDFLNVTRQGNLLGNAQTVGEMQVGGDLSTFDNFYFELLSE